MHAHRAHPWAGIANPHQQCRRPQEPEVHGQSGNGRTHHAAAQPRRERGDATETWASTAPRSATAVKIPGRRPVSAQGRSAKARAATSREAPASWAALPTGSQGSRGRDESRRGGPGDGGTPRPRPGPTRRRRPSAATTRPTSVRRQRPAEGRRRLSRHPQSHVLPPRRPVCTAAQAAAGQGRCRGCQGPARG